MHDDVPGTVAGLAVRDSKYLLRTRSSSTVHHATILCPIHPLGPHEGRESSTGE